jgi:hypothetical protein
MFYYLNISNKTNIRREKMKQTRVILAGLLIILGLTGMAGAAELVYYDDGTTQYINSINRSNITGTQMAGILVTVEGSVNGNPFTATQPLLADFLINQGYVSFAGDTGGGFYNFTLLERSETYLDKWVLANFVTNPAANPLNLRYIKFDGFPGNVVFDSIFDAVEGTPGSGLGRFTGLNDNPFPIQATYRDLVALEGKEPVGDLSRYLDVFVNKTFNTNAGFDLFIADTDRFKPVEVPPGVPVPASLALLGSGLLVLSGLRRFRKF